ncbi:MAG: PIN domain nuclease [Vicinamibacterales bacterium]
MIVDTTVWVDYLNGISTPEVEWFDRESERQRLGVLDLTVCEVLQGVSTDAAAARVLRALRRFEVFDTGGIALAEAAARNHRRLRARGRTVRKTIDCLIATLCLEHSHALLHCDGDFDPFEDVSGCRSCIPNAQNSHGVTVARSPQPGQSLRTPIHARLS